jgi:hypothetical protein
MSAPLVDEFNGDTAHLIRCIEALIALDAAGVLVPHGIGGHAHKLLSAAAVRLANPRTATPWIQDAEEWGNALNDAGWAFLEACPEKSALLFNNTKGPLRAAILKYAESLAKAAEPHCTQHRFFDTDCLECADVLEKWRAK